MIYKNFYYQLIIRILFIGLNTFWISLTFQNTEQIYTLIVSLSLLAIQMLSFVYYFNKTNRNLTTFFSSLLSKDYSNSISKEPLKSISDLRSIADGIKNLIQSTQIEKENHYNYLQQIIAHINTGLISINKKNKILLMNEALKSLFEIPANFNNSSAKSLPANLQSLLYQVDAGEPMNYALQLTNEKLPLLVRKSSFIMNEQEVDIISFQDVKHEMEEKELESWQKLISILSHEIMNSMTPITTLTHAIKKSIENEEADRDHPIIKKSTLEDIISNTNTIEKRSLGLINFVNNYRNLSKVKTIHREKICMTDLFKHLEDLFRQEFKNQNIDFQIEVTKGFQIYADSKLIEQVLINLIKNGAESFIKNENKRIKLKAYPSDDTDVIEILDNGRGISNAQLDQIFIPFFTTKENGSGIGLSLCRQIMRLHKGKIQVKSKINSGTKIMLKF